MRNLQFISSSRPSPFPSKLYLFSWVSRATSVAAARYELPDFKEQRIHIPLHVAIRAFPIQLLIVAIFRQHRQTARPSAHSFEPAPNGSDNFFQEISSACPSVRRGKFLDPAGAKEKIGGFFGRENPAIYFCIGKRPQATWGCEDDFEIRPFYSNRDKTRKARDTESRKNTALPRTARGALPRRGESYDLRRPASRTI